MESIYVLNPAYYLKKDRNRVILTTFEDYEHPTIPFEDFTGFIHPLNAQMLTFFNGKDTLEEVGKKVSHYFGLSLEDTKITLARYIENEKRFSIKCGNVWMFFPEHLIIKKDELSEEVYGVYEPEDFPYTGTPDFFTDKFEVPQTINMLLTMKCYTDCIYCYANRKMKIEKPMELGLMLDIIKQAKEAGVEKFDINGGEVLLHPHYKEVISALLTAGFDPFVSTKVPLGEEQIRALKDIGLKSLQISLDSINPKTLSKMLSVNESYFEKIKKTIENIGEAGIKLDIHAVITSHNSSMKEMEDLTNFALSFSHVKKIVFSPAGYSIYKPGKYKEFRSNSQFIRQLNDYVDELKKKYPDRKFNCSGTNYPEDFCLDARKQAFGKRALCTGNLRGLIILPDGRVTVCEELYEHPQFIIGDLSKQTLLEVWDSKRSWELYRLQQSAISKESACRTCAEFDDCRQGRGVCWKEILMAYGYENWDFPDPKCPKAPQMHDDICLEGDEGQMAV